MKYNIDFVEKAFPNIELEENSELSTKLTVQNSPILFGCRTGICGTCLIKIHSESPHPLHPRTANEEEFLEGLFPGETSLRLACQIKLNTNIKIEKEKI